MNYFVYINKQTDNSVGAIIPEFDPIFPDVPIMERFSKEFLDKCRIVSADQLNNQGIQCGMLYHEDTNTYVLPPKPEPKPEPKPKPEPEVAPKKEAPKATVKEG